MADTIPDAVKSNIPISKPMKPYSLAAVIAPCIKRCPKLVIGTIAPPPAQRIILSYKLNVSKNAPSTTNIEVIWPGVSLVLSSINCPIKQTNPQNRKEFTYIIKLPPN